MILVLVPFAIRRMRLSHVFNNCSRNPIGKVVWDKGTSVVVEEIFLNVP